jgi:hypothetical protein
LVRTRRADLYIYCSALAAIGVLGPGGPLYWDSFGYIVQAMNGQVGGLGFGRPLFILISHVLASTWFAVGGSAAQLEPVLRTFWALVACLAAPFTWRLARRVGLTYRAAALAGLAVAVSPAMAHVAGSVLTDGPATAMCVLASLLGARAVLDSWDEQVGQVRRSLWLAGAAGVAFGVAVGLREQSLFCAAGLALLLPIARRSDRLALGGTMAAAGLFVVAVPMAFVWLTQPGYLSTIRTWLQGMAHDRAATTFAWHDAGLFLLWTLSLGPVVVIAAISVWVRRSSPVWRVGAALFAVSAPALAQLVLAAAFRGINYSPRFLLPAFPAALAIPGAWALDRAVGRSRNQFIAACLLLVLPLVMAAPVVRGRTEQTIAAVQSLPGRLETVPPSAVIVTGQPCPAIALQHAILEHDLPAMPPPRWQPVCPGWAWPVNLRATLDAARANGRTVVIDMRPGAWVGIEQTTALDEAGRYAASADPGPPQGPIVVWR